MLHTPLPAQAPFHDEGQFCCSFGGVSHSDHNIVSFSGIYNFLDCAATAIFNVMELPATQVPLGLDNAGRPLGVQVVADEGQDHLTIAVAIALANAGGRLMGAADAHEDSLSQGRLPTSH